MRPHSQNTSRETLLSLQSDPKWIHNFTTDLTVQKWRLYCDVYTIFYGDNYQCLISVISQKWPKNSGWWIMTQKKHKFNSFSCHVLLVRSTFLGTVCKPCNKCGGWGPTRFFSTTGSNDRWPFWIHWCMEKVWNRNCYIKISSISGPMYGIFTYMNCCFLMVNV